MLCTAHLANCAEVLLSSQFCGQLGEVWKFSLYKEAAKARPRINRLSLVQARLPSGRKLHVVERPEFVFSLHAGVAAKAPKANFFVLRGQSVESKLLELFLFPGHKREQSLRLSTLPSSAVRKSLSLVYK